MISGATHQAALAGADLADLERLRRATGPDDPDALRAAAVQFEALFIQTLLGTMRESGFGDELFGSEQGKLYQGMFDREISVDLAHKEGIGLADLIVRQLTPAVPASGAGEATGAYQATARLRDGEGG